MESERKRHTAEPIEGDDLDAYVATFTEKEREELAAAEAAIDIAILLHRAREQRGLSQEDAAQLAGLRQQAVSRFEQPGAKPQMETIRTYLAALGYAVEFNLIDLTTGQTAYSVMLPPAARKRSA